MKNYLHRWVIESLSFMALGLFGSLIIGLILDTIGKQYWLVMLTYFDQYVLLDKLSK